MGPRAADRRRLCSASDFEDGAFASLTYSGYGHFDSDEFQGWIGEMGQAKQPCGVALRALFRCRQEEIVAKNARNYGGSA